MPEEERLSLVSEVEDEFTDDLLQLEDLLADVDDQIRDTGRGRDHVKVDVEVTGVGEAVGELDALDAGLEAIDDEVTVDVEADTSDVISDDVTVDSRLRGSQFRSTATGQPVSGEDAIDERFNDIGDAIDNAINDDVTVNVDSDVDDSLSMEGLSATAEEADAVMATSGGVEHHTFSIENIDDWGESVEPFLDRETLGRRGGEVTNVDELLGRDIEDVVDFEHAVDLAVDSDSEVDMGTLQGVTFGGPSEFTNAINDLDDEDATLLGSNTLMKQIRRLRQDMDSLRPTMTGFHNAVAATIPLMVTLAAALPAALVGIGALATAAFGAAAVLGGIGALGLMGMSLQQTGEVSMQPITNRLSDVAETYISAFAPLAHSFAPVIESAISSVEMLAGPLADASAGLLAFRDEFRGLVGFATSALPSFTQEALAFTAATMPLLTGLTAFLANVDVFGILATQLSRALPALTMIGAAVVDILPVVMHLSQGFLTVAGVVAGVVGVFANLLGQFPMLLTAFGVVTGALFTVVSATALWSVATGGLIGSMVSLASTIITTVLPALTAKIASLLGVAAASWTAYTATAALLGLLSVGLIPVVASLGSIFSGVSSDIANARKELEEFAKGRNALNADVPTSGRTPTSQAGNVYRDHSTTVINAGSRDDAARQQYSNQYERREHINAVFGSG
ncbi:hypothetical protein U3A55_09455 [Salarchaeum sp. III]|uniref:hypothetical protein n=1 Tax=Salarchaeum sp. III TaxID=3107927 RepID=UPI002EDA5780